MVKRRAEMADWLSPAALPVAELNDAQRPACLRLNRSLFVIPGNLLDPRVEGTNDLLKTGATLVTEPDDIL